MYVIIALILLVIFVIRVGADKLSRKISDSARQSRANDHDKWVESVTDKELESEMHLYVNNPDNQAEIIQKLRGVYNTLPSCKDLDINHHLLCNKFEIIRVLMALNGKLTVMDATCGLNPLCYKPSKESILEVNRFIDVLTWVDSNIQSTYCKAKLVCGRAGIPNTLHNIEEFYNKWHIGYSVYDSIQWVL